MGVIVKSISAMKLPQDESLTHALRWWLRSCFILGLPLSQPNYGFRVKVFTTAVLIADLAMGLFVLGFSTKRFLEDFKSLGTLRFSSIFAFCNAFVLNSTVHAILVWKLDEWRAVIYNLGQLIIVDLKLQKFLQIATVLILVFETLTQCCTNTFLALTKLYGIFNELGPWQFALCFYWASLTIYPVIASFTITATITVMGYQFKLLKDDMQSESFLSWDKLYGRHVQLCTLTEKLQQCFSLPLTVILGSTLISLCMNAFYITNRILANDVSYVIVPVLLLLDGCIRSAFLCASADYLKDQVNSLALQLAQVDTKHLTTPHIKETVRRFSANIRQLEYLTTFSVGGFCHLGKPLLLGMLSFVMTYFVLLCQLDRP